jgi:hypothetical protein
MGDVTLWYQIFWFKHRACMGQYGCEFMKFIVTYFVYDRLGENKEEKKGIPNFVSEIQV